MSSKYRKYIKIYKSYKKFSKKKSLVWCRYYLDDFDFNKRVNFVSDFLKIKNKDEFVMEVQYWENNDKIMNFFDSSKIFYTVIKKFNDNPDPGVLVCEGENFDLLFFKKLLQNHYNSDFAKNPALSVKILLFFNYSDYLQIFDFYDDRGFIINYYYY